MIRCVCRCVLYADIYTRLHIALYTLINHNNVVPIALPALRLSRKFGIVCYAQRNQINSVIKTSSLIWPKCKTVLMRRPTFELSSFRYLINSKRQRNFNRLLWNSKFSKTCIRCVYGRHFCICDEVNKYEASRNKQFQIRATKWIYQIWKRYNLKIALNCFAQFLS